MKYMFEKMEDWAEIMGFDSSHPQWEAFQVVWNMARAPGFADEEEETDENIS